MTRETKIGLLVGLAFIIVIGILLSDYNRNEIQNAALPLVANNISSSTATLHNGGATQNEVVPPPAPAVPSRTVLTRDDLHQPTTVVELTPGPGPLPGRGDGEHHAVTPNPPIIPDNTNITPGAEARNTPETGNPPGLVDVVPYDPHPRAVTPMPVPPVPAPPTVNGARQYVAVAGDTLSKLAGRFMGANTKTNRDAILAINPSLKANPNNVIVGKTYMIPGPKTAVAAAPATPAPAHTVAAAPAPAPTTDGPHYYYTVRENDNLWKIASEQLGDGTAWAAIKELNKEVLKGREDVRPNMRLRLPAKPVASIN